MTMTMGRWLGALGAVLVLQVFAACGSESSEPPAEGQGGTDPKGQGGTNPQGQGGTNPQGQGGTNPQGQGGTDPDPTGTTAQGQGGTDPQGQGGSAGEPGLAGAGGQPNFAGAAGEGGAAGASATCTTETGFECPPCDEGSVHIECGGPYCVCERDDHFLQPEYEGLLACDLDEPCSPSTQTSDVILRTWENGECLLEALRDRTPGKYQLTTRGGIDGIEHRDFVIILDGSDTLTIVEKRTVGLANQNLTRSYWPGTCTLKSHDELDACVSLGTVPSLALDDPPICDSPYHWIENCELSLDLECPAE